MREFKPIRIAPLFVAAAVLVGCAFTGPASAGNFPTHWVAPVSGDWTDPTRWSTNPFYPENGNPAEIVYDTFIDAPGPDYTVTLDDDVEVNRVVIRSPAALMNQPGHTLDLFFLGLGDVGAGRYRMSDGTLNLIALAVGGSGW